MVRTLLVANEQQNLFEDLLFDALHTIGVLKNTESQEPEACSISTVWDPRKVPFYQSRFRIDHRTLLPKRDTSNIKFLKVLGAMMLPDLDSFVKFEKRNSSANSAKKFQTIKRPSPCSSQCQKATPKTETSDETADLSAAATGDILIPSPSTPYSSGSDMDDSAGRAEQTVDTHSAAEELSKTEKTVWHPVIAGILPLLPFGYDKNQSNELIFKDFAYQ